MIGPVELSAMKAGRGPRHLVYGTIRRDEFRARYATSAAQADEFAAKMDADKLRQVRIIAPVNVEGDHADALRKLAADWQAARDAEIDLRQQVHAATVTAVQAGMSESEAARLAGIDRMTVRKLLGK